MCWHWGTTLFGNRITDKGTRKNIRTERQEIDFEYHGPHALLVSL